MLHGIEPTVEEWRERRRCVLFWQYPGSSPLARYKMLFPEMDEIDGTLHFDLRKLLEGMISTQMIL
jgi:hypothetical protein